MQLFEFLEGLPVAHSSGRYLTLRKKTHVIISSGKIFTHAQEKTSVSHGQVDS